MLIYDENVPRRGGIFKPENFDATSKYLLHYANQMVLKLFHTQGTTLEKIQAAKELIICERKMAFWARQVNYDQIAALRGIDSIKAQWK